MDLADRILIPGAALVLDEPATDHVRSSLFGGVWFRDVVDVCFGTSWMVAKYDVLICSFTIDSWVRLSRLPETAVAFRSHG